MKEKIYIFQKCSSPDRIETLEVKESELTQSQKDLLYGELIRVWNNTDSYTQQKFLNELFNSTHSKLEEELFITSFLNLFPKGVRTGGKLVRSDLKGCEKKMKQFLKDYKYNRELILKATESYVNKFKDSNYKFMKAAIYFIGKKGEGSTLAEECENYLNRGYEVEFKVGPQFTTLTGEDYKKLFE